MITRAFSFTSGAVWKLARMTAQQPNYTVRKLKKELRRWWMLRRPASGLGAYSRSPFTVLLNLTSRCNLRCKMCGQHGETGMYAASGDGKPKHTIEFDVLSSVIDELAAYPHPPDVCLWGGEPLLYPHLSQLLSQIRKRKLFCVIETNGTLLERFVDDITDCGIDTVNVSILGPRDLHDRICRVSGSFDRLVRGVRKLVEKRQLSGRSRPLLKAICTITPDNYTCLTEIAELVERLHFDVLVFSFGWFTTEALGKATDRLYRRVFGCACTSWRGFAREDHGLDLGRLRDQIRSLRGADTGELYIKFSPNLSLDEIPEYYEQPSRLIGDRRCVFPWMLADIRPDGDVVPCPDHPDYVVGNVKQESFQEIWNGPRMRKFRRELSKRGTFPICSRCCGMFT